MIRIAEQDLSEERQAARDALRAHQVPARFQAIDAGVYGFTRAHLDLLECLETALAVLTEAARHMTPEHAIFVSATIAIELAPEPRQPVRVQGAFPENQVRPLSDAGALVRDYLQYVSFYESHPDEAKRVDCDDRLVAATRAYFQLLANGARELVEEPLSIEVLDRRIEGFALTREQHSDDLLEVWPEDVVGNADFLKAGLRLARDVAGFDLATRANPKRLNPVLFAMGDPGCGKTVTCHAIGNYFLKYCRDRGIPARFVVIRRTDWASSYQNASAQQLVDIFKQRVAGFEGVVGVYWPDIDTAFAARSDAGLRSEEKGILGASFGIFDGTLIPKNGQWFMLCDANTLNMDQATISRITQDPFQLKGPVTAEDFVDLLRNKKLASHQSLLPITDDEWLDLGRKCIEGHLSGRAVENISRRIVTEIEDFEYPEHYFKTTLEERKAIIKACSRPVTAQRLSDVIDHYQRFEQEAEDRANRQRFQERVREIVFNMSAQAAALRATDG